MAATLGVSVTGLEALSKRIADLPRRMDAAERETVGEGAREALALFRQKVSGSVLKVRSNAYRAATNMSEPARDGEGWGAAVGVKDGAAGPYAEIHETGGTIRPKQGKYLTIPVGEALHPSGVPRYRGPLDPELEARDVFWIFPKGRNPLVVESDENDELSVLFVAVKEVTLPARRPLGRTAEEMRPRLVLILANHVERALNAAA